MCIVPLNGLSPVVPRSCLLWLNFPFVPFVAKPLSSSEEK